MTDKEKAYALLRKLADETTYVMVHPNELRILLHDLDQMRLKVDIARDNLMGGDHNMHQKPRSYLDDFECPRCGHCCKSDLATVGEVGVWGVVQCEPQEALEDGWCDWVCPKPQGYLMQCCDCELIHEVDFRVVQYEPKPSEVYEVVDDPNLQAQMRLRRRDDLSPKREWVGLTLNEAEEFYDKYTDRAELINAIDKFLEEKNA